MPLSVPGRSIKSSGVSSSRHCVSSMSNGPTVALHAQRMIAMKAQLVQVCGSPRWRYRGIYHDLAAGGNWKILRPCVFAPSGALRTSKPINPRNNKQLYDRQGQQLAGINSHFIWCDIAMSTWLIYRDTKGEVVVDSKNIKLCCKHEKALPSLKEGLY